MEVGSRSCLEGGQGAPQYNNGAGSHGAHSVLVSAAAFFYLQSRAIAMSVERCTAVASYPWSSHQESSLSRASSKLAQGAGQAPSLHRAWADRHVHVQQGRCTSCECSPCVIRHPGLITQPRGLVLEVVVSKRREQRKMSTLAIVWSRPGPESTLLPSLRLLDNLAGRTPAK